jgi:hypothetical protein
MAAPPFGGGHRVVVGHGLAAQGADLRDHPVGRRGEPSPEPVPGAAEVVDHHLGAAPGQFQGIGPAQARARAGDDGHPAVEADPGLDDVAVLEFAVVDDHVAGLGVDHPPEGLAFAAFQIRVLMGTPG